MDWSGWWSWSKKCIQGTWYNPFALSLAPPPFLDEDMGLNCDFWISFTVLVNRWTHVSTDGVWLWFFYFFLKIWASIVISGSASLSLWIDGLMLVQMVFGYDFFISSWYRSSEIGFLKIFTSYLKSDIMIAIYWCTFNAVPAKKMLQRNLYRLPFVFLLLKLIDFQYFSK
jgi:hypothetical protein